MDLSTTSQEQNFSESTIDNTDKSNIIAHYSYRVL